ncbi:probable low affinity copper uptake protein 2 isoform X2 [Ctenocephalides felis]|uniref:probable low affinity copper uptake protein 2 isoform X2 n=1 Tax=Ctenocephalides felis TaxID=7515 RepID=UPI000E6E1D2A|nr:probable low affinity copper uptake protein 2 isoform X2 [Ctenocephalides felis]
MFSCTGIIYESLKVIKTKLRMRAARETRIPGLPAGPCQNENSQLLSSSRSRFTIPDCQTVKSLLRELSLHLLDGILGYAVMLSVMLYNGYMFIAVILGAAIGHFVFGYMSRKINMENVQARTTTSLCVSTCPDQASSTMHECKTKPCTHKSHTRPSK